MYQKVLWVVNRFKTHQSLVKKLKKLTQEGPGKGQEMVDA